MANIETKQKLYLLQESIKNSLGSWEVHIIIPKKGRGHYHEILEKFTSINKKPHISNFSVLIEPCKLISLDRKNQLVEVELINCEYRFRISFVKIHKRNVFV